MPLTLHLNGDSTLDGVARELKMHLIQSPLMTHNLIFGDRNYQTQTLPYLKIHLLI